MDRKLECRKGYSITPTPIRRDNPKSPINQTDLDASRNEDYVISHRRRERLQVTPDNRKPAKKTNG